MQADVTDAAVLGSLGGPFEAVVHLAAFKIPRYGKAIDTLKINYRGTECALELARRLGCKLVLASTSDVYGRNPALPFSEEHTDHVIGNSKSPRWAYAVSKLFDEHLALAYQDAYGFPVTILRFFGSYGPKQPLSWWGGPPPVFIDCVLNDKPIPIHGDGSQTRSFTYVTDTVEGIYQATVRPEANGEIINIGNTAGDHDSRARAPRQESLGHARRTEGRVRALRLVHRPQVRGRDAARAGRRALRAPARRARARSASTRASSARSPGSAPSSRGAPRAEARGACGMRPVRIGIIGGGLMGLALAERLGSAGHRVTVYERAEQPGGLATWHDFGPFTWDRFYHVILPSDTALVEFIRRIGLGGRAALARDPDRLLRRSRHPSALQRARFPEVPAARPLEQVPARGDDPLLLAHPRLAAARGDDGRGIPGALLRAARRSRSSGSRCCSPSSARTTGACRPSSSGPT